MSILNKLFGSIFNKLFGKTPEIKEATGFDPENVGLMEVNGVTYGLSYQDNDDGSSKVKLLISPSSQSKTYEWDTGINVANKYKGQLSLTLVEASGKVDKVGIIFPEKGLNKNAREEFERLSFNVYEINHSVDGVSVKSLGETKLQRNIDNENLVNLGNRYYLPKVVKTSNGDLIVIAHNLETQELVAWLLEPDENGQLKPLVGIQGNTEKRLLKFDNPGQLAFSEETISYSQRVKGQMGIFPFSIGDLAEELRDNNKVDECLLASRACIINKAPSVKDTGEISFMQYATNQKNVINKKKGKDLIAFIEKDQSSKKQSLRFFEEASGKKVEQVYEFTDSIKQLYIRDDGQGGFTATAVSRENVITFNVDNLFHHSNVTFIPARNIKSLSDFVSIINGHLTPEIISNSTVAPIVTEQPSTVAPTTTEEITEQPLTVTPIPTEKITEQPTSAIPTVTNSTTKVIETTTGKGPETSTVTNASSPVTTMQTTTQPTQPTTPATPQVVTTRVTTPADTSSRPTRTIFTIPSSTEAERTTLPSSTESEGSTPPTPHQLTSPQPTSSAITDRSSNAGLAWGTTVAAVFFVGLVALGYTLFKRRRHRNNAASVLELGSLVRRSSDSGSKSSQDILFNIQHSHVIEMTQSTASDTSIKVTQGVPKNADRNEKEANESSPLPGNSPLYENSRSPSPNSHGAPITEETQLDSMSVEGASQGSSRSPSPISFSSSTNSHGASITEETQLDSMSVEGASQGSSRSPSPGSSRSPLADVSNETLLTNLSVASQGSSGSPLPGNSRSSSPISFS